MILTRKAHADVLPTDNLFQSGFWAAFREGTGGQSLAFECDYAGIRYPLVVQLRLGAAGERYAYVPRGPYANVEESALGPYLEELSEALRGDLPSGVCVVRYDTEFLSPYTDAEFWSASGQWLGAPRAELRELRMNWGTRFRRLRKSPVDHLCPDTVIIDLIGSEEAILSRMRSTTRNGVRRALRSGVEYRLRDASWLGEWHRIYADTARRKAFYFEGEPYFRRLFDLASSWPATCRSGAVPAFQILSADKDGVPLAAIILGVMGRRGYYLYAGSTLEHRECMPNYGLQWEAIRFLRGLGCAEYDLMGVPPNGDPNHAMYGLYTFKTGLGGRIVHYAGCWDYPLDDDRYARMANAENMGAL
jgi:lipid II:glycine glycyltransferase (peptidoglycan interpeptide bridge formation enzyme)